MLAVEQQLEALSLQLLRRWPPALASISASRPASGAVSSISASS